MKRHARLLILFCTLAITGLLTLQFYWIKNYYAVHKAGFEKEVKRGLNTMEIESNKEAGCEQFRDEPEDIPSRSRSNRHNRYPPMSNSRN